MKFRPLGKRLVIQKIEDKEVKTASGIIITGESIPTPKFYKVLKTSNEVLSVKEGDEIMISVSKGPILIEETECIIITEDEIVGVKE